MNRLIGMTALLGLALGLGIEQFESHRTPDAEGDPAAIQAGGPLPFLECAFESSCWVGCISGVPAGGSTFRYNNGHSSVLSLLTRLVSVRTREAQTVNSRFTQTQRARRRSAVEQFTVLQTTARDACQACAHLKRWAQAYSARPETGVSMT